MYYQHFGLKEPPFKITPNTDFFFSGGNRGAVLDALVYAITNGEGIVKVVGEVGSGKTMLCRMLQSILPEKIESIYLANPSVAPEDVLHAIAFELQLKVPKNADRLKVMQLLQAHLLCRHAEGRQVVIFVEEAQGMPLATLEEIRLLSNLETKQDKLLQIVLFGQPELDVNLSEANIRQLRERITHSFNLEPLDTKVIGEYLISRLRAAGYHGPHPFSEPAIKKLSGAAEGLARRVNILADKSLLAAYADNMHQVTPLHVKAAIQDSEFWRKTNTYKKYFLWLLLSITILLGLLSYFWRQYQFEVSNLNHTANVTIKIAPTKSDNQTAVNQEAIQKKILGLSASKFATLDSENSTLTVVAKPLADLSLVKKSQNISSKINPIVSKSSSLIVTSPTKAAPIDMRDEHPVTISLDNQKSLVEKRMEITKKLLESGQPSAITLQIKSLPSDKQINTELDKLSQQLEIDNIYIYHIKQNGVMYTVFVYGAFEQRGEALTALQKLPISIKNNKPYLRTFAGIRKDIEQAQ